MTARIIAAAAAGVLALAASPSLASGYGQGGMAPPAGTGGSTGVSNPCLLGTAAPGQCVGPVQITGGVTVQAPNALAGPGVAPVAGQVAGGNSAGWQSSGSSFYSSSSSSSSSASQMVSSSGTGGSSWSSRTSGEVVTDGVPVRYSNAASGWGPAPPMMPPMMPPPGPMAGPAAHPPVVVMAPQGPAVTQGGWAVPPAPPHPGQGVIARAPTGPGCTQQMIAQQVPCPGVWVYATQPQPAPVHPPQVVVHPAPLPVPLPGPVPGPQGVGPIPPSFFAGGISNGVGFNSQQQWSSGGGGIAIVGGGTRFSGVAQRSPLTPPPRRAPPHNPPPAHKPCGC